MKFTTQLSHFFSGTVIFAICGILAVQGPKIVQNPKDVNTWIETISAIGVAWRARVAIAKSGTTPDTPQS